MRKISLLLALMGGLAGCGQSEPPASEPDVHTVEELAADLARLKELRQQCKTERANLREVLCDRVADATRKRFYGDGTVPYTPSDTPPKY